MEGWQMSFLIIHNALQSARRNRGLSDPPSLGGRIMAVVLVMALVGVAVWMYVDQSGRADRVAAARQQWDAGIGRPAADTVEAGATVVVKASVGSVNNDWDLCDYHDCDRINIRHYPLVVPIGGIVLADGCYTNKSGVVVNAIMVSTNRPDVYSVALGKDGTVKMCAIGVRNKSDRLVYWSDSPNAAR